MKTTQVVELVDNDIANALAKALKGRKMKMKDDSNSSLEKEVEDASNKDDWND